MSARITRRQLAIASAAVSAQAQAEPKKYGGALDGFESKVDLREFDPVAYTLDLYRTAPLRLTFRARTKKTAESWQNELRPKIAELLGGFPAEREPIVTHVLEEREFPSYKRLKFWFESRPGCGVVAYLLTPKEAPRPLATVVCVPGHGRGVDDVVGIDEYGRDRGDKPGYEHDFAIQVAEHGMAALAVEPMAFGCRRDGLTASHGLTASACQPTAGAALLLGQTMIGWRAYDVMRAIDWIESRPELDAKRAGCMGISGGGTCTLFSAALDTRIRAAFVSCYLNTFRDSVMSLSHCIDNYVPGILNWAEQYDVAGLIAPRALIAESGERDPIFPVAASRASFAKVKKVYETMGAPERIEHHVFDGEHEFNGARGIPFLAAHLANG